MYIGKATLDLEINGNMPIYTIWTFGSRLTILWDYWRCFPEVQPKLFILLRQEITAHTLLFSYSDLKTTVYRVFIFRCDTEFSVTTKSGISCMHSPNYSLSDLTSDKCPTDQIMITLVFASSYIPGVLKSTCRKRILCFFLKELLICKLVGCSSSQGRERNLQALIILRPFT